jgi:ribose transport system ATP-binding protein
VVAQQAGELLVEMDAISKDFPGVHALRECRFDLRAGEVHALVGENGAGKSTLMKILAGVYRMDAGRIRLKGADVDIPTPRAAQQLGISIIHQELSLMPNLTVAQNIFIGREPRGSLPFLLDERGLNRQARDLFERLRLKIDPQTKVANLTVARQQIVEIAKALSYRAEVATTVSASSTSRIASRSSSASRTG